MAVIRDYSSQVGSADTRTNVQADASSFGGGAGLQNLGQAVTGASEAVADYTERKEMFQANLKVAQTTQAATDWIDQQKKTAPPGAPGFADSVKDYAQKQQDATLASWDGESPRVREQLQLQLGQVWKGVSNHAAQFQTEEEGKKAMTDTKDLIDQSRNRVRANPAALDLLVPSTETVIRSMPWGTADMKEKAVLQARNEMYDSALDGRVVNLETNQKATLGDVNNMISKLSDQKQGWIGNASSQGYDKALDRLQRLKETITKRQDEDFKLDFAESMDQKQATGNDARGFTQADIMAHVTNPREKAIMLKRFDVATQIGNASKDMAGKSFADVQAELRDTAPGNPNSPAATDPDFHANIGIYKAKLAAFDHAQTQFKQDPAGYVMSNSAAVASSYQALSQAQTPEDKISAADQYAAMAKAEQQRLKPGTVPSLLPKDQVGAVGSQMSSITQTPDGAKAGLDTLSNLQNTWGKHFPSVVNDLRKGKALNDEQYVAATMVDKPEIRYLAEDMMKASVSKTPELTRQISGANPEKTAREAVVQALAPLSKTIYAGSLDAAQTNGAMVNALTKLVLYHGAQKGQDASGEAADLVKKIYTDHYDFQETYRIPRTQNTSLIKTGVENVKASIPQMDIIPPPDLAGRDQGDAAAEFKNRLQSRSVFVTDGQEKGVRLLDERGRAVMTRGSDGKPTAVRYSWSDLQALSQGKEFDDSNFGATLSDVNMAGAITRKMNQGKGN